MNRNTVAIGKLFSFPRLSDDLCVGPHSTMMHYAPPERKCLLHHLPRYPYLMGSQNERLRQAREEAGFETQEAAAEALGMNAITYRQHENDTRGLGGIPRKRAEQYAKKFKVSLEWLLTGRGVKAAPDPVPSEEELEAIVREVLDAGVTVETRLADLPKVTAPLLHEKLTSLWLEKSSRHVPESGSPENGAPASIKK